MSNVDKKINFSLNTLFWTPETEKEMVDYFNNYGNASNQANVWLGASIGINYILNKINKEFDIYKKGDN